MPEGTTVPDITINLLQNGTKIDSKVLKAGATSYTFDNLALKDSTGKAYTYTVSEDAVGNYASKQDGNNFTNTYNLTSVSGTKTWVGVPEGTTVPDITINLLQNGTKIDSKVLKAGTTTYTFDNLPLKDAFGKDYTYTVSEDTVSNYISKQNGNDFVNIYNLTSISGTKTWARVPEGTTVPDITINLLQNGTKIDSKVLKAGTTSYTFDNLALNDSTGKAYTYTVREDAVTNYYCKQDGFDFTNTYKYIKVSLSKIAINGTGELPGADLKVVKGENTTGTIVKSWHSTSTPQTIDLEYDQTYTMVENNAPSGYYKAESITFRINGNGKVEIFDGKTWAEQSSNTVVMKDALIPTGTVDISGTKSWNDANDKYGLRPASITVYLNANGVKQYSKKVTAADNWSYSFTGLNQYDSQGNTINYSISEGDVEYYTPSTTGNNLVNTLDESFSLVIKKTDRSSAHVGLPGTTYALYRKGTKTDVEVGEYTTGSDGTVTATNLPAGQYYLKETKAPAGYTVDPNPSAVITLGDKNNGNDGNGSETVTDVKIVLNISKQDLANGKELPGATLSIIDATTGVVVKDKDGNDLTWVSGTSPKSIDTSNLEAGKEYLLTEVTAPNGYYVAETIRFKIGEDENSAGTTNVYVWQDSAWTLVSNQTVVMKDSNTENPSHPSTTGPTAPNVSPSSANPTGSNPSTPNLTPNNGGGTSTTVPNASNSTTTSTVTGSGSGSSGLSSGNANTGVNGSSLPIAAATLCALGALVITAVYKRRKED